MDSLSTEDGVSVDWSFFLKHLTQGCGVQLSQPEKETLIATFGAKSSRDKKRLNLKPLLQLEHHQAMTNTYKSIQYRLDDFHEINEVDTAGYFGTDHRMIEKHTITLTPLNDLNVVVAAFAADFKMVKVMQTIRSIDRDKNGFVTNQELEDILKLVYRE